MSKPGKENSTVMLCKEVLKRRVHKGGAPWKPNRKTWDVTGLRYVLILHIVVVQRLHCVLDVLCSLCGITVRKNLKGEGDLEDYTRHTFGSKFKAAVKCLIALALSWSILYSFPRR